MRARFRETMALSAVFRALLLPAQLGDTTAPFPASLARSLATGDAPFTLSIQTESRPDK